MKTFRPFLVAGSAVGALLAVVISCSDSNTGPSLANGGMLTVQLTDAPFPFDQVARVDVFVDRIDAKTNETDDVEAADASDTTGWTTVAKPNGSFNLLELTGGTTTTLGADRIPTGTYRGFRLIINTDKSSVTLKDGTKPNVKWPSAGSSGLKVHVDQPVVVTSTGTIMVVDFDVGNSFVMRGNSISQNGLLFKPVINAIVPDVSGSVSGSVRADNATGAGIANATIEVLKAGTALDDLTASSVMRTGSTDADGHFKIGFLTPGTYVLRATPPAASSYKPALLVGTLTITSGKETSGETIIVTK